MGRKAIDLKDKRFGKLLVLEKSNKKGSDGSYYWTCKCDCGNIVYINGSNLRNGHTKSCGCVHGIKNIDLTNQQFGKLKVIKMSSKKKYNKTTWICQCECGNIVEVVSSHLINGHTLSCGCLLSKGEEKISKILKDNNIIFEQQKTFDSCRFSDTKALAKFDFYLPEYNILIEYDGEQHFQYRQTGWNTKEKFLKTQEHDIFKTNWCKENNYKLIRISYLNYNNLSLKDLL